MTKSLQTLILSFVGAAALVAGAFYFGAPLFGWLIMIAIFGIYLISAWNIFCGIRSVEKEKERLKRYGSLYAAGEEPSSAELEPDGLLNGRIRFLKMLRQKNIKLTVHDMPFLKSVWSNEEDTISQSHSGVVVLLGLMGTFFGLMLSINAAGSAIDSHATSETTLGIIQNIFSSMKGIFGSSLCGLFAALILNAIHSVYESCHEKWIVEMDAFTLLHLIPGASAENGAVLEIRGLIDAVKASDAARANDFQKMIAESRSAEEFRSGVFEKSLAGLQAAGENAFSKWQQNFSEGFLNTAKTALQNLEAVQNAAVAGMRESIRQLSEEMASVQKNAAEGLEKNGLSATAELRDSLAQVTSGLSDEMQKLSASVSSIESGVVNGLEKEISNLSSSVSNSISQHLHAQMENSGERWNAFMESLRNSTEKVAEAEQKGLETLRSVAEEVALRANDSTVGLSSAVKEEIENLSQKVQSSFLELARSSETLVASQQNLISGIESRVAKENESTEVLGANIAEAAKLMRVNQSEFSANLEMFGKGVEAVLAKISGDVPERENEKNFVEQLNSALQSFEERSGEVLLENALKTQEILLEILDQVQKAPAKKAE